MADDIQPIAWRCECGGFVPVENSRCSDCGRIRHDSRPHKAAGCSLPWTWKGGYPQTITGPDAALVAQTFENPDKPATIAPLICGVVNAHFGWDASKTYDEVIRP